MKAKNHEGLGKNSFLVEFVSESLGGRFYNFSQAKVLYSGFSQDPLQTGSLTYQVTATDPDGDPVTFSLIKGPNGMTIEPKSGLLQYSLPQDNIPGSISATVKVEDDKGASTTQDFTVSVTSG